MTMVAFSCPNRYGDHGASFAYRTSPLRISLKAAAATEAGCAVRAPNVRVCVVIGRACGETVLARLGQAC